MPRKRTVRTSKPTKNKDRTGEMAMAMLIDTMLREGVVLDKRIPFRVAKVAKRLGWSYQETSAFAKKLVGTLADRVFAGEEPEPEPKKPDIKEMLTSVLGLAQLALKFVPDGATKGKGGGINPSSLLNLAKLFAGDSSVASKKNK